MDGAFPSQQGESFDENSSAGGGFGRGGQRRGFKGTAENAKTKLCARWQQGDCRFGDRCNFAHGTHELRKLPPREENGGGGGGGRFGGGPSGPGPVNGGRGKAPAPYNYPPRGGMSQGFRPQGRGPGGYEDPYAYGAPGYGGGYGGGPGYAGPGMDRPMGPAGAYGPVGSTAHMPGAAVAPRGPTGQGMPEDMWAAQGYPVQGPDGWVMYRARDTGEYYYHNHRSNTTQWERPAEWPMQPGQQL